MQTSIVIPAYNEEKRITPFLLALLDFSRRRKEVEVIIVNDGSTDKTLEVVHKIANGNNEVKIVSYECNRGKGWAVKQGIETAQGEKIVFIDADGSIPPSEIPKMLEKLDQYDIVVGDRTSPYSNVTQSTIRRIIGIMFNSYVRTLFQEDIPDHLCGFKGFKKHIAKDLFMDLKTDGWIFDVELFHIIKKKNYSLFQLPISWEYKKESKLNLLDPIKMALQLLFLRWKLLWEFERN